MRHSATPFTDKGVSVNTRTIAIIALVVAVILVLAFFVF